MLKTIITRLSTVTTEGRRLVSLVAGRIYKNVNPSAIRAEGFLGFRGLNCFVLRIILEPLATSRKIGSDKSELW
jgi:hypothetical protein